MTSANRESLAFIAESSWGTTPSTPTGQKINFTSTTLGSENETTQSNFIRSDTNRAGTVRTGRMVAGDIGIELQYGGYDSFLEGVYRGAFSTPLNVTATDISFASSDNSINSAGAGFGNAVVGQYIRISGASTAGNNGYARVVTKTNSKLTLAGITLTNESAGASVTVKGSVLSNSTTQKSFTIQRHFEEITQFMAFTGVRMDQFQLNIGNNSIVTGSFAAMGKVPTRSGSTIWSATTAAATTESYNSVDHLASIWVDDTMLTTDLTEINFTVGTNAQKRAAIGSLDGEGIIQNSISVSGSFTEYFENGTLVDKYLAFTPFQLAFVLEDAAGNAYVFNFPTCNPTQGKPDNGGIDTQITIPDGFDATLNSPRGYTCSITRIPA